MTAKYLINATIDATDAEKVGMNVADFFYNGPELLRMQFDTMDEAGEAAKVHYRGPDVDGIGAVWTLDRAE